MTFSIKLILTLGGFEIEIIEDERTAVTSNNSQTTQNEHTVLITEQECVYSLI